jgi:hypothetical protein
VNEYTGLTLNLYWIIISPPTRNLYQRLRGYGGMNWNGDTGVGFWGDGVE